MGLPQVCKIGAVVSYELYQGDAIEVMRTLPANSVQCCVTSPPYFGLRDYGHDGQIGLENTPDAYIAKLVEVFREVRRVLRDDGVLWLNLGDSYGHGTKATRQQSRTSDKVSERQHEAQGGRHGGEAKQLLGIPWRVAFALQADGYILRSEIIWHKRAPMPESVTDRPTKAHEQVFLLTKSAQYFYDAEAIAEPANYRVIAQGQLGAVGVTGRNDAPAIGVSHSVKDDNATRNRRSVWTLGPESYAGAHFAVMPTKLVEPCILAGSRIGDTVLDPFSGSGTTLAVARKHGRNAIGIDLSAAYNEMAHRRIAETQPLLLGGL
jgi:DNA modification methylase